LWNLLEFVEVYELCCSRSKQENGMSRVVILDIFSLSGFIWSVLAQPQLKPLPMLR
jgi:hypothetical protein